MLSESDLLGPQDYLFNNLGLSLNDYYWICPLGSKLKWEDVNLYDNDFKDDLLVRRKDRSSPLNDKKLRSVKSCVVFLIAARRFWQI